MNKIYIVLGLGAVVFAAYGAGIRLGSQKCQVKNISAQQTDQITTQKQIIKIKGEIHAETVTSATDVIRGRLRATYTIGD